MFEKTKNTSDAELVVSYQSGNQHALAVLVKRWHFSFCKLAYWYVKDAETAKDIAQESWTVIYKKLHLLESPEKFKSWAISIVSRKSIDWIRASNRKLNVMRNFYNENSKEEVFSEQNSHQQKKKKLLREGIAKLPENQKEIIGLYYLDAYSLKELSEILEISIGTVKSRLFYAREKLKSIIKYINYE